MTQMENEMLMEIIEKNRELIIINVFYKKLLNI